MGIGLIPPVDNVHTFEAKLPALVDNRLFSDTSNHLFTDLMTIGMLNDPQFGSVAAEGYVQFSYPNYLIYPFLNKDSVVIDSVILQVAYEKAYGDTLANHTLEVYEINPTAAFSDTVLYKYAQNPNFSTLATRLGTKTFAPAALKDSTTLIFDGDTAKIANVIRIPLSNSFGQRFVSYDTSSGPLGAYHSDSLFKTHFKGLALKSETGTNSLVHLNLANNTKSHITIYCRVTNNGILDTMAVSFIHAQVKAGGQANYVRRTPAGDYNTYLTNSTAADDKLYLQSAPGSAGVITIPALDTFSNAVIHRATLVLTPIAGTYNGNYWLPDLLYLDRLNTPQDSAFTFEYDALSSSSGYLQYNPTLIGGALNGTKQYVFDITRYVQNLVTNKTPNMKLRVSAPVHFDFYYNYLGSIGTYSETAEFNILSHGRAIIAGANTANVKEGMHLQIIYSKIK